MTEQEYTKIFVEKLRNIGLTEIYQEVKKLHGGFADVVIKHNQLTYGIEMKLGLSDTLIEQVYTNQNYFNYSYGVCMFKPINVSRVKDYFIEKFNIGVVSFSVDQELGGRWYDKNFKLDDSELFQQLFPYHQYKATMNANIRNTELYEEYKQNEGGIKGERITPFKISLMRIKKYCEEGKFVSYAQMWRDLHSELHWSSSSSMQGALRDLTYLKLVKEINDLIKK